MVLSKLLRAGEGRKVKKLQRVAEDVSALEDQVSALSDEQLRAKTDEFRDRLESGEDLEDLQAEAFAVVRQAAQRVLGQRPYDVQVLGGAALHNGDIAEMKTGEGKTLTSTMPIYLNALTGRGVHVVTVNPYLASRDAAWMGRVYEFMGLEVGLVFSRQRKPEKRAAYAADVTYGTNNEFGFDYLRDHMVLRPEDKVQRGHYYAIVDEVDSILVDEARTPLIISGPTDQATEWYTVFAKRVVPRLDPDAHYEVDEGKRTVGVTEEGVTKVEELLGVDNLYESVNTPLIHHLQNAIRAKELYLRDDEYIVEEGEVHIVDEHTGRTLYGRRYSEGLHQAIEAKEGVKIKEENQTLATITLQNYYRQYEKLAGMTGTAKTEEGEFAHIYEIGVVEVPTNRPIQRLDQQDFIYKSADAKMTAVLEDVAERHERGQPVLIGTTSVERSEELSKMLNRRGIPHEVLNAKNHFKEAEIIAQAGRLGAVTVATNMAGRGVDIMLGGNPESVADTMAKRAVASAKQDDPEVDDASVYDSAYQVEFERLSAEYGEEREKVRELGGLYVLGTERHESRRIDNQLRGRSGRQGDPGESRFYLSIEDDLLRLFNARAFEMLMTKTSAFDDAPLEAKQVSKALTRAQTQVESRNFEIRKNVLKYDDVMNTQRQVIYEQRNEILEGVDEQVAEHAEEFIRSSITAVVGGYASDEMHPEEWDFEELWVELAKLYPLSLNREDFEAKVEDLTVDDLTQAVVDDAMARYAEREEELGADMLRKVERRVILSVVDRIWREHLYEMDHLRDGIGLRAVGQRDPLMEYRREAHAAFTGLLGRVKEESTGYFFNLPVETIQAETAREDGNQRQKRKAAVSRPNLQAAAAAAPQQNLEYSSSNSDGSASYAVSANATSTASKPSAQQQASSQASQQVKRHETVRHEEKVGRNDPCPCGSGLKYKRCHGA